MEVQAGVELQFGFEVVRRMTEALSHDEDGDTAIRHCASAFLQTPVRFTNGTYAATLQKWASETRSIPHMLNSCSRRDSELDSHGQRWPWDPGTHCRLNNLM